MRKEVQNGSQNCLEYSQQPPVPKQPRTYRTREDPLAPFWSEIEALLKQDSKLKPYILLDEMCRRHPGKFLRSWQRTLERRVDQWKVEHQVEQEVFFDQDHMAGDVLALDFSHMNQLCVTIAGEHFDDLIFHGVLTYSNWEYAEVCLSESFEALAGGVQRCFHAIGGVTERVRTDSMSAAIRQGHMTIEPAYQDRMIGCHRIDPLTHGQLATGPVLVIPITPGGHGQPRHPDGWNRIRPVDKISLIFERNL